MSEDTEEEDGPEQRLANYSEGVRALARTTGCDVINVAVLVPSWVPEAVRKEIENEIEEESHEVFASVWLKYSPRMVTGSS